MKGARLEISWRSQGFAAPWGTVTLARPLLYLAWPFRSSRERPAPYGGWGRLRWCVVAPGAGLRNLAQGGQK